MRQLAQEPLAPVLGLVCLGQDKVKLIAAPTKGAALPVGDFQYTRKSFTVQENFGSVRFTTSTSPVGSSKKPAPAGTQR
ncbi:MAG: hypothetical protein ACOZIN_04880 [Myxococcota bacterium]